MAMFPDAWMGELLSKSDIVALISEYTALTPKGRRLWGLCPFHGEKTASFSVTPDKQMYYCFGCHAGGGVIQFVMEAEKLSFVEAVKFLAQRAGMELPGTVNDEQLRRERAEKERLYAACRDAARYYCKTLLSEDGRRGREYLMRRGIDAGMVKKFGLGYAKPGWNNLTAHLESMGYKPQELIRAGLAVKNNKGDGYYDAYRDRVMFPIIGTNGRVLGFGARTMGDEQPKYLNTGDTPVFNKRYNLYALNLLKGKQLADIILCEGYMDVISLHHAGVDNAVASLGTSLTTAQAHLLKRYVNSVYICYDGDSAGQNAALRGLDILAAEGLSVRVMRIPGGMDPDDYVKKHGREGFMRLKDDALALNLFKLEFMAGRHDLSTEDGREAYAVEACALIGSLQPVEQERYYTVLSRKTGLPVDALKAQGAGTSRQQDKNSFTRFRNTREKKREVPDDERFRAERTLLACLAQDYDTAMYVMQRITPDFFSVKSFERFATSLLCAYAETRTPEVPLLLSELASEDAELVAQALFSGESIPAAKATADDCIRRIERLQLVERVRALTREAEQDGLAPERRSELTHEILELQKRLKTRT